ncbi:LytR C-terminal domain-containing protein, partial [Micromonospora sp. NPDC002575]|uniref:LytR C-terminal domain-containing protein n=1 Tax=Micromonospora sp. NPDC002575 TaxID=3364222 RepID=UPI0036AAEC85
ASRPAAASTPAATARSPAAPGHGLALSGWTAVSNDHLVGIAAAPHYAALMSMLTPPGMGGQYRITGDKYPRMRRPRRRARRVLAAAASLVVLGTAGWGTLQLIDVFSGGGGDSASAAGASSGCAGRPSPSPSPVKALTEPRRITVNVLNATTRAGLAKQTADALEKRGFRIGDIGNADAKYDKKVKGTAILLGPASAADSSLPVLAAQIGGAEPRTEAGRKGATLDLIIGDGFRALTAKADAERTLTALTAPAPTPATARKDC